MEKNEQLERNVNYQVEVIKLEKVIISFLYVAFSLSIGFISYYNQLNFSLLQAKMWQGPFSFIPYGPTFQYYLYFSIIAIFTVFSGISFMLVQNKKIKSIFFTFNLISFFITMSIFAFWIYKHKDSFYYFH